VSGRIVEREELRERRSSVPSPVDDDETPSPEEDDDFDPVAYAQAIRRRRIGNRSA